MRLHFIALPVLVALSANATPAAASCLDEITVLERRIAVLEGATETVRLQTRTRTIELEREVGGAGPAENWFGQPPTLDGAANQLENARAMAGDDDETGCIAVLAQVRRIVEHLEP